MRYIDIYNDVSIFYDKKTSANSKWEEFFLTQFYVYLDTPHPVLPHSVLPHSINTTIDKRYMIIENLLLKSLSPISKHVLDQFYFPKLNALQNENKIDMAHTFFNIYKDFPSGSFAGHLFEKIIISKLLRNISKGKPISINYFDLCSLQYKKFENFTLTATIYFNRKFSENTSYDQNYLFLPLKCSNPYTDFLFFILKIEKCFLQFKQQSIFLLILKAIDTLFQKKEVVTIMKNHPDIKIIFIWITRDEKMIKF